MAERATHKMIDGQLVELTPEESARIEAQWEIDRAKPRPDPFDQCLAGSTYLVAILEQIALAAGLDFEKVKADAKSSLNN